MTSFRMVGGRRLCGTVAAAGAKNAALPIMAAALLADGPVRLANVPRLADVDTMARVLRRLGMRVRRGAELTLETVGRDCCRAPERWVRKMRASFCVLGPLLARRGRAVVPLPGGCRIGDRPVDLHLRGLAALGAEIRLEHGLVIAAARRLRGAEIELAGPRGPTVTGTANVLSAAVLAEGRTTIRGAAREPEIVDLGRFLIAMGARIEGLGTGTLHVVGVPRLTGRPYRIIPDRIEAATLLMAAAITGGDVCVTGCRPAHLRAVLDLLAAAGACVASDAASVRLTVAARLRPIALAAAPYPGTPTDLQAQWTALLALAAGTSRVADHVFPGRISHLAELRRLGADIEPAAGPPPGPARRVRACTHPTDATAAAYATVQPTDFLVHGVARLQGAVVTASDLRASAALVLAGLAARGETIVRCVHHLDRGYERLDAKLRQLGARIERVGRRRESVVR